MEDNDDLPNPFAGLPDFMLEGVPALLKFGGNWSPDPTPFPAGFRMLLRHLVKIMKEIKGAKKIGRKQWTTKACKPLDKKRFILAMTTADAINRLLHFSRLGVWILAVQCAFDAGTGFQSLMDSAYDETLVVGKKVSRGGKSGAEKAHGDRTAKYRAMQDALDEYRASHPGAKVRASQKIVAMQHAAEGWTESTVRRADEARK